MVFMDVHMPQVDGVAAARGIRTLAALRSTPIVALTADVTVPAGSPDEGTPFDAVLVKPVDEQTLHATIAEQLRLPQPGSLPGADTQAPANGRPALHDPAKALANADGSHEVAGGMMAALIDSLPQALGQMRSHFQHANWEGLQEATDRLKGPATASATPALLQTLEALAEACRARDRVATAARLGQLQQEADRLLAAQAGHRD
jgi:CheY-like chemotaxis protein